MYIALKGEELSTIREIANALEAFFISLDNYTLADLLPENNQKQIIQILGLSIDINHS